MLKRHPKLDTDWSSSSSWTGCLYNWLCW